MLAAVLAIGALAASSAKAVPANLERFASGPAVIGVAMSETGRYVALAGPGKASGDSQLTVLDFGTGGTPKGYLIPLPGVVLTTLAWKGDARVIIKVVKRDVEVTGLSKRHPFYGQKIPIERTIAMNPDGTQTVVLFGDSRRMMRRTMVGQPIASLLPSDPTNILMSAFDGQTVNLYRVDVVTGAYEEVENGGSGSARWVIDWQADSAGRPWLRTQWASDGFNFQVQGKQGRWRDVSRLVDIDGKTVDFMPLAIAEDGDHFYAAMRGASEDKLGLALIGLEEGGTARTVFSHPSVDIGAVGISASANAFAVFNVAFLDALALGDLVQRPDGAAQELVEPAMGAGDRLEQRRIMARRAQ